MIDKKAMENKIVEVLKTVYDPEIPVDVYELGLIYDIQIDDKANTTIVMTLTTPSCPVAESLPLEVENRVKNIEEVKSAKVDITFEPPWNKDMISETARFELGFM